MAPGARANGSERPAATLAGATGREAGCSGSLSHGAAAAYADITPVNIAATATSSAAMAARARKYFDIAVPLEVHAREGQAQNPYRVRFSQAWETTTRQSAGGRPRDPARFARPSRPAPRPA